MSEQVLPQRKQKAVYWARNGFDSAGEPKVDSPVEIDVRWEKTSTQLYDDEGTPITITDEVWVGQVIPEGSILWEGELANLPNPVTNARQVYQYVETPDIDGEGPERIVLLRKYRNSGLPTVN